MSLLRRLPSIVSSTRCYLRSPVLTGVPRYLSTIVLPPDIDFDELNKKLDSNEVKLFDVRLPKERVEGMIPRSQNFKLQSIGPNILLTEEEFAEKCGFSKPPLNEPMVLSCNSGVRARTAQLAMLAVGYKNVRVYVGSYEEWVEKGAPIDYAEPEPEPEPTPEPEPEPAQETKPKK